MKYTIFLILVTFGIIKADDTVILKSGRKVEGTVIVKDKEVYLIGKYGTIIYNASDVTIEKSGTVKSDISDNTEEKNNTNESMTPVACQVTTRSGRKIIGNVFQKGNDLFFVEFGGIVKIDPFVFTKKEVLGGNGVKGDVISGEKCNVVLKSGRAFSGIVEEYEGAYFVSSAIGTVKVEKKDLDHIERSGLVLNLKEEQEKLIENATPPTVTVAVPAEPKSEEQKKSGDSPEMTVEEMIKINKKVEEALKEAKEVKEESKGVKDIKTVHELH